jgi:hypothetical protein
MVGRGFHKKMLHMQQGPQHTPADPENSKAPTKRGFGVIQQRLGSGADIDGLLVQSTFGFKGYMAIDQSKQSVVATNADVAAGVEFGTTLAHDDRACADQLTTEGLHTQHFWLGITSVARRAAAFFLCHD